ncbi:MAG: MFS transporter [Bacteroidales bacterium]|nr:MFS transporter [Bacteroidales bacterium]
MDKTITLINEKMTQYRWTICALLFFATTINYMDRQVLSLLQPRLSAEFGWTNNDYANIVSVFSFVYAMAMLFAGRIIDWLGTKKGYAWSIAIWSAGACMHALAHLLPGHSVLGFSAARTVLAVGEGGNFPAAIKTTAEYFPKKDRAFATGIFNSGSNVGAILAPITVPIIADKWGWEWAFILIGALGFIWMIAWLFLYEVPALNKRVNKAEMAYIESDSNVEVVPAEDSKKESFTYMQCLRHKQTWAFAVGKFMTDGVWWFFLFWLPAYLKAQYNMEGLAISIPLAVLYTMSSFGSVFGGAFPAYFIKKGYNPYAGRMKAMLIIAVFPLVVLLAPIFGSLSYWVPVVLIGIGTAAHQAWSANIFSTVGDMFPKKAIATITGIGGMAGGIGSVFINKGAGEIFDYYQSIGSIETGYAILFVFCAIAYMIAWGIMKLLVPKFKPITNL